MMKRNLQHTREDISRFVFSLRRLLLVMTAWLSGSHAVLRTTLFLWLCRLPFLVLYFPGSFAFPDTEGSVQHYFGYADLTTVLCGADPAHPLDNHHPILYTFLYGGTIEFGNALGSQNAAVFLFLLLQSLLHSWLLALAIDWLRRYRGTKGWLTAVYALCPFFGMWTTLWLKDSFYALCTTALMVCLLHWTSRISREGDARGVSVKMWLVTVAVMLLFMASKNQCIYIILLTLCVLPFLFGRRSARLWVCGAVATLLFALFLHLLPTWGVAPSGRQEKLGVLFQQTARYVHDHPEEVTDAERKAIDAVLPFDSLATAYQPALQDPVKFMYRRDCTAEQRNAYYAVWWEMAKKHPSAYVAAVWDCCDAYFHPSGRYPLFFVAHIWSPDVPNLFHLQAAFPNAPCGMAAFASLPLVGWMADMGFYVLLFLFFFFWALWKRDRAALLVAQPCLWAAAVLWVAPANGEFRYVLPILWNLPLLAALIFSKPTCAPSSS